MVVGARWVVLLVALGMTSGCASELVDEPPDDPTIFEYVYRADAQHKAPHRVEASTSFDTLRSTQGPFDIMGITTATVERPQVPTPPTPPPGAPAPPGLSIPASLVLRDAKGLLTTPAGTEIAIEGRDIRLSTPEAFDVHGLAWITASRVEIGGGRATVSGLGPPIREAAERSIVVGVQLGVDPAGLSASSVNVSDAETDEAIGRGNLLLEQGSYDVAEGTLSFVPSAPVRNGQGNGTLELTGTTGATLNGEDGITWSAWDVDAVGGTFSADVASSTVDVSLDVQQLYAAERPQFEGALRASVHGVGPEDAVELAPGENTTLWVEVTEISGVGSVPNARPQLDDGGLDATVGTDWYATADPHVLEEVANAFKQAAFGLFIDFRHTYFSPLETKYIVLHVGVPEGVVAGTYAVTFHVNGETARSNDVVVSVTVT